MLLCGLFLSRFQQRHKCWHQQRDPKILFDSHTTSSQWSTTQRIASGIDIVGVFFLFAHVALKSNSEVPRCAPLIVFPLRTMDHVPPGASSDPGRDLRQHRSSGPHRGGPSGQHAPSSDSSSRSTPVAGSTTPAGLTADGENHPPGEWSKRAASHGAVARTSPHHHYQPHRAAGAAPLPSQSPSSTDGGGSAISAPPPGGGAAAASLPRSRPPVLRPPPLDGALDDSRDNSIDRGENGSVPNSVSRSFGSTGEGQWAGDWFSLRGIPNPYAVASSGVALRDAAHHHEAVLAGVEGESGVPGGTASGTSSAGEVFATPSEGSTKRVVIATGKGREQFGNNDVTTTPGGIYAVVSVLLWRTRTPFEKRFHSRNRFFFGPNGGWGFWCMRGQVAARCGGTVEAGSRVERRTVGRRAVGFVLVEHISSPVYRMHTHLVGFTDDFVYQDFVRTVYAPILLGSPRRPSAATPPPPPQRRQPHPRGHHSFCAWSHCRRFCVVQTPRAAATPFGTSVRPTLCQVSQIEVVPW